ncbi:hypothetical protein QFC21_006788 [Naganishia friedmannii]|uniref:Uncharacterized protein n=1 Tax=Naganishia friedmannii TaxID=89922 RepID=A0ACC2UZZ4_9TREE|nr:hypothetical protein QFC21_006788 [Naganishia friedmannii]
MSRNPAEQLEGSPSHRRILSHPDILDALVDLLVDLKAYGTILRINLLSNFHHDIVQPRLNSLKKRIVLVLDDYLWVDRSNDKNIEQVTSNLIPRKIVYHSRPHESVFYVFRGFFPKVSDILFSENIGRTLLHEADGVHSRVSWFTSIKKFNEIIEFYCVNMDNDPVITLRHYLHTDYRQPTFSHPGQRHYILYTSNNRSFTLKRELCRTRSNSNQGNVISHINAFASLPELAKFQTVSIDCYVRLPETTAGYFFYGTDGDSPPGYRKLSDLAETTAIASLVDSKSILTMRFFIVGHGNVWQDKADVVPLYVTTCGVDVVPTGRRAVVIKRDFDENFARCVVNNGCARCRQ